MREHRWRRVTEEFGKPSLLCDVCCRFVDLMKDGIPDNTGCPGHEPSKKPDSVCEMCGGVGVTRSDKECRTIVCEMCGGDKGITIGDMRSLASDLFECYIDGVLQSCQDSNGNLYHDGISTWEEVWERLGLENTVVTVGVFKDAVEAYRKRSGLLQNYNTRRSEADIKEVDEAIAKIRADMEDKNG